MLQPKIYESLKKELMTYFPPLIKNTKLKKFWREWLLDTLIKKEGEEHFEEIMDLIFSLLVNENDELNPLEKALELLKKEAAKGKINMKDYRVRFKVLFDNHNRKDGFELLMAMNICDPTNTLQYAYEYLIDDKANDASRAKILQWYFENVNNDEKILALIDRIQRSSIKSGNAIPKSRHTGHAVNTLDRLARPGSGTLTSWSSITSDP